MRGRNDKNRKKSRQPAQTPAKQPQPSLPERLLRLLTGGQQHDGKQQH